MEYIKANEKDMEQIVVLVQETVEFFSEFHCKENICKDILVDLYS